LKDVPIWVFNGEVDPTTTTEEAGIMVDALRRAGGKPRFTILPGLSHGDSQDAAYRYRGMFNGCSNNEMNRANSPGSPMYDKAGSVPSRERRSASIMKDTPAPTSPDRSSATQASWTPLAW
jgi:hypothetical protein